MLFSVLPRGAIVAEMSNVGCRMEIKKAQARRYSRGRLSCRTPSGVPERKKNGVSPELFSLAFCANLARVPLETPSRTAFFECRGE